MTRYQALRQLCGCGPVTAGFVTFLNFMFDNRPGLIVFMTLEIEYDPGEAA